MRLALSHEATKHGLAFRNRMQPRFQPTAEFKELILRRLRASMSQRDCERTLLGDRGLPVTITIGYDSSSGKSARPAR